MKSSLKEKINMILFVVILGTILSSSLVLMDGYTKPIIERNKTVELKSSVLDALSISYEVERIDAVFAEHVDAMDLQGRTVYLTAEGVFALPYDGSGLWGPITGILAVNPREDRIVGLTIMHQEETPGLGSRIAEPEYLKHFVDKRFEPDLKLTSPGGDNAVNEVDSIAGATISSNAFVKLLNEEYSVYEELLEGEI
ncbi:MAG TPA: FMN-binding protein [Sediminispirochaeta sp.]|nr:FMN-binding protein [Sediminispirochaeta sp.]